MAPKSSSGSGKKKSTKTKAKPKTAKQLAEEEIGRRTYKKKKAIHQPGKRVRGQSTQIAKDVRKGTRRPPPVPDAELEEIEEMDPDDPAFKHPQGRRRKYEGKDKKELPWKESIRADAQARANKRRAKVRKREAVIVKTEERKRLERGGKPVRRRPSAVASDISVEDEMYADGLLNIDDWDDEELVRGYRRNRNGKFGSPPKYIPMEVQQECLRRIIRRGKRNLDGAYIKATELLIELAQTAESEKVRLEATKEVMDRVGGKVPDHLKIDGTVAPYEQYLADSLEPLEEVTETTTNQLSQSEWDVEFEDDESSSPELEDQPALPSSSSRPTEEDPDIEADVFGEDEIEYIPARRR